MTNRPSDPGEEDDSGEESMPRPERSGETAPDSQERAAPLDRQEDSAVDREEQALRAEFAKLGFIPVDPSTLEKGLPLTHDDWQALFRFYRNPGSMSDAEKLRIIRLKRSYDTWYFAEKEVIEQWGREIRAGNNQRN